MLVKVGENLMEAVDEYLKTGGPNFDVELCQPASKNHWEIPGDSQGIEKGNGVLSGPRWFTWTWRRIRGESWHRCRGLYHRGRTSGRMAGSYGGRLIVGHLNPLVTGLILT